MSTFLGQHICGCLPDKGNPGASIKGMSAEKTIRTRAFEEMNSQSEIRNLLEDFRKATGMPFLKLVAPDEGTSFVECRDEPANPLCVMIGGDKETCRICADNQRDLINRTAVSGISQEAACFVGLSEFSVPVMEGRRHVASGHMCSLRPREQVKA